MPKRRQRPATISICCTTRSIAKMYWHGPTSAATSIVASPGSMARALLQEGRDLDAAVIANQRAVSLAQQLYQRGLADFLNVLQAQLSLYLVEDQLVRSYAATSNDVVVLYKSLGGGWEEMPQPATQPVIYPATQPIPWVTMDVGPTTQRSIGALEAPRPTTTLPLR